MVQALATGKYTSPIHTHPRDVLLWMVTNIKGGTIDGADFPVRGCV